MYDARSMGGLGGGSDPTRVSSRTTRPTPCFGAKVFKVDTLGLDLGIPSLQKVCTPEKRFGLPIDFHRVFAFNNFYRLYSVCGGC